ncbi:MAG: hypothetical protein EBV16_06815, partial [Betaproteobacteria bacterium]|nr:hypothetical protein [Betaproteobacteria bacterium]
MSTDHNDTQPDQAQASLEDMAERLKPLFPGLLGIECYAETGQAYDMLPSPEMLLAIAEKDP